MSIVTHGMAAVKTGKGRGGACMSEVLPVVGVSGFVRSAPAFEERPRGLIFALGNGAWCCTSHKGGCGRQNGRLS